MGKVRVSFRCSTGEKFEHEFEESITVGELKAGIADKAKISKDRQRLIYHGRVLKEDENPVETYGVLNGDTIHVVQGMAQSEQTPPSAAQVPDPATAQSSSPMMPGMPPNMGALLDNPMVRSMMENPEFMRSMMMANPQVRAMIERNPQLGQVLNDPELLRTTLQAARNPAIMNEMLRNQDRAMANIESLPGGYNALARMYEEIAPAMESAAQANGSSSGTSGATSAGPSGPNPESNAIPNPWGSRGNSNQPPASTQGTSMPNLFQGMLPNFGASVGGNDQASNFQMPNLFNFNQFAAPQATSTNSTSAVVPSTTKSRKGPNADDPNPWASPTSPDAPQVRYKDQLKQMEDMGFPDEKANIQALLKNDGNVEEAIETLIKEMS